MVKCVCLCTFLSHLQKDNLNNLNTVYLLFFNKHFLKNKHIPKAIINPHSGLHLYSHPVDDF